MTILDKQNASIIMNCHLGRSMTNDFDYTDDKGVHHKGTQRVIQLTFEDAGGVQSIAFARPCRGWDIDLSQIEHKKAKLAVTIFRSVGGKTEIVFCGCEEVLGK